MIPKQITRIKRLMILVVILLQNFVELGTPQFSENLNKKLILNYPILHQMVLELF